MRRSTSGTLGACGGSTRGFPVSRHGLQAERRVAEGLRGPRLRFAREGPSRCLVPVASVSGRKEGRRLSPALSPAQRFGAPTLRALVSVRVSRVLPGPLLLSLWAHPPLHPARLDVRVYRCHESHTLRQRVGVPLSRNIPSAG